MRRHGGRLPWIALAWTPLMLTIAIVLAVEAMASVYEGKQACFVRRSAVPCPANADPAATGLLFAILRMPLAWLPGIGVTAITWALRHGRAR